MEKHIKKPTFRIGTLAAILIINIIFMLCIVEVCAAQSPQNDKYILYDIPLSDELQRYTFDKCEAWGLSYEMVLAIMYKESRFTEKAISATNDYGIMQINKSNHKWLAKSLGTTDFLDAKQNIDAGTFHLRGIANNGYDDIHKILMVYNLGGRKAKELWHKGIGSTAYSKSVVEYMESLSWMKKTENFI